MTRGCTELYWPEDLSRFVAWCWRSGAELPAGCMGSGSSSSSSSSSSSISSSSSSSSSNKVEYSISIVLV
jgi:hypothetical protein